MFYLIPLCKSFDPLYLKIKIVMHRAGDAVFETPPRVPKLPTLDQLPNHGRTAFLKWLEAQNPCMGHNNFRAETKKFAGT